MLSPQLSSWAMLIFWTSLCLILEAFFSGSELAMVSVDKLKLAHQAGRGHRGAKMALWLARHPEWLFSTTLLGQNLFIVGNTVYLTFLSTSILVMSMSFLEFSCHL
ncbi:MAG: DUF21 domain-containing protein [Deltaproteobacteria bacterium]|nr:MAG: DUF21 domain-containing protein [Deltaproteobacteria bacterium]